MLSSPGEIASYPECEAQEEVVLESSIDSGFSIEITITDNEEKNHDMPQEMQGNSTEESQKNATISCEGCRSETPTKVLQDIPVEDDALYNNLNAVSEESWFLNSSENVSTDVSRATSQATSDNSPPQAEEVHNAEIYAEEMSQHLRPLISPIPEPLEEVEENARPSTFSFSSFGNRQVGVKRKRVDDRLDAIEDTLKQHTNEFYQLHQSLERLKEYFEEQEPEDYFGRFVGRFIFGTPGLYGRTRLITAIMQFIADEIQTEETEMSNSEL